MNIPAKSMIVATASAFAVVTAAQAQEPARTLKTHAVIDAAKLPPPATQKGVTYAKDIRPLFEASCFRCHGEKKQKGGLRLDSLEAALKGGEDGKVVMPGDSAKSFLVTATSGLDTETAMPPKRRVRVIGLEGKEPEGLDGQRQAEATPPLPPAIAILPTVPGLPQAPTPGAGEAGRGPDGEPPAKPLTPEQVGLVRAWIDQGAK